MAAQKDCPDHIVGLGARLHTGVWNAIFLNSFLGQRNQKFQGVAPKKSPLGNQFSRYDPSGKLNPTGPDHHHPSGKLVLTS